VEEKVLEVIIHSPENKTISANYQTISNKMQEELIPKPLNSFMHSIRGKENV